MRKASGRGRRLRRPQPAVAAPGARSHSLGLLLAGVWPRGRGPSCCHVRARSGLTYGREGRRAVSGGQAPPPARGRQTQVCGRLPARRPSPPAPPPPPLPLLERPSPAGPAGAATVPDGTPRAVTGFLCFDFPCPRSHTVCAVVPLSPGAQRPQGQFLHPPGRALWHRSSRQGRAPLGCGSCSITSS